MDKIWFKYFLFQELIFNHVLFPQSLSSISVCVCMHVFGFACLNVWMQFVQYKQRVYIREHGLVESIYAACVAEMCIKVCMKDREKRAEGRRQPGVWACARVNRLDWSTHTHLTQNARSFSSASRGAPCPLGVCGDRNMFSVRSM